MRPNPFAIDVTDFESSSGGTPLIDPHPNLSICRSWISESWQTGRVHVAVFDVWLVPSTILESPLSAGMFSAGFLQHLSANRVEGEAKRKAKGDHRSRIT